MENCVVKEKKGLSRYRKQLVFLMDLFLANIVYFVMIYWVPIRNGTTIQQVIDWMPNFGLMLLCLCGFLWASKSYDSLWRYAETDEYISMILMGALAYVVYFILQKLLPIPKIPSVLSLCIYSMSLLLMMTARFIYRKYRMKANSRSQERKVRCAIIGAGNAGVSLLNEMKNNSCNHYQPVCFFDDDPEKIGKFIHGIEVKGKIDMMPLLLRNTMVTEIIFAIPSADPIRRKEILEMCSTLHCHVKVLPDTFAAVQSGNLSQNVRNVKIDDLLGRERIVFNNQEVFDFLRGKVVMVTGGGGSIGSELCRQIAKRDPKELVVVDIYENNAYDLQQELKMEYHDKLNLKVEIASVRDREKVRELGGKITADYKNSNLMLVTVLKGAVVFLADLMRQIDVPAEIDFMVVSSYGSGVKSSGVVKIVKDLDVPLAGKDILIVEDILDSGLTLSYIKELLESRGPRSIRIATLLDKPSRRKVDLQADYIGFSVPDEFVIGYGLDYDEKYRNLPYIGILKPEVYSV